MREFFDTSVLVAVFWGDHPRHRESLRLFARATPRTSACGAHSLAEVYAVLTRLPVRPPVAPEHALLFVREMEQRLTIATLGVAEHLRTIQEAAERGLAGGRIYDALLLRCARKTGAETIYTWNATHFQRIAPDLAERICTP